MSKVQEYDFRRKYFVIENIEFAFPQTFWRFINTSCPGGLCSSLYFPQEPFEVGFFLPIPSLVHQFLHYTHIHLIHIHSNIIHVLMGISIFNFVHEIDLDLEKVLFSYSLKLSVRGKISFCTDSHSFHMVMGLLTTNMMG